MEKMKRYWLFMYSGHYPTGGMNDFFDWYDSIEEAETARSKVHSMNYQILDANNLTIIRGMVDREEYNFGGFHKVDGFRQIKGLDRNDND